MYIYKNSICVVTYDNYMNMNTYLVQAQLLSILVMWTWQTGDVQHLQCELILVVKAGNAHKYHKVMHTSKIQGSSCLHIASQFGHLEVVKYLCKRGQERLLMLTDNVMSVQFVYICVCVCVCVYIYIYIYIYIYLFYAGIVITIWLKAGSCWCFVRTCTISQLKSSVIVVLVC